MKQHISAKAPVIAGKQYHIDCKEGDVARYVLLPGDPARVGKIARGWDSAREVAHHREYHTMTGAYKSVDISCVSTGIGSPSLTIGVDELSRIGVDTFIRVGTTGGIQKVSSWGILLSQRVRSDWTAHQKTSSCPSTRQSQTMKLSWRLFKLPKSLGCATT